MPQGGAGCIRMRLVVLHTHETCSMCGPDAQVSSYLRKASSSFGADVRYSISAQKCPKRARKVNTKRFGVVIASQVEGAYSLGRDCQYGCKKDTQ
eukprot:39529-Amphidinium_carterae.1